MRVALNLLYLLPGVVGGTETYAAGLLSGLQQVADDIDFIVFLNEEAASWPIPDLPNFHRVVCPLRSNRRSLRYAFEQLRLPALLKRHRADLVHSLGYVGPLYPPCPSVVTIHDLNFVAFGDQMPTLRRLALKLFVTASARRAQTVIVDTEHTRSQLNEVLPEVRDIVVVPLGVEPGTARSQPELAEVRARLALPPRYFIAFASLSPNKNLPRLIQAFDLARGRARLAQNLVLIGHCPPGIEEQVARMGCRALGYLSDADRDRVLAAAEGLIFPSLYEGFGLPILEAMEAGVPVLCSNRPPLPEVAGNAAAFFDPLDTEDLAARIVEVAGDAALRERLGSDGRRRSKEFSWRRTAESTVTVYAQTLAKPGPGE